MRAAPSPPHRKTRKDARTLLFIRSVGAKILPRPPLPPLKSAQKEPAQPLAARARSFPLAALRGLLHGAALLQAHDARAVRERRQAVGDEQQSPFRGTARARS